MGHWLRRDAFRVALLDVCRPDLHHYRHAKDRHAPDPDHRPFPPVVGDRSLGVHGRLDFDGVALDVSGVVVAARRLKEEDIPLGVVGNLAIDGVDVVVDLGRGVGVVRRASVIQAWRVIVGLQ